MRTRCVCVCVCVCVWKGDVCVCVEGCSVCVCGVEGCSVCVRARACMHVSSETGCVCLLSAVLCGSLN